MSDLINRDDVLAYTEKQHKLNNVFESEAAYICFWEGINDREGELKAKDVPPVKRGHWMKRMSTPDSFKCSRCGNNHEYETTFCPNCGADMREGVIDD